jgi:hypothetical protein
MKKFYFLLFALSITSLSFGQSSDLYFSMYGEGSSSNKFVEIYNGTGGSIDLSNYMIRGSNNGGDWKAERDLLLSGTLNDGDVYVIADEIADASILAVADLALAFESPIHFNGDDAIGLFKDDGGGTFLPLDIIGVPDADPGSGWEVAGVASATANHTLTRKSSICDPNVDWALSAGTDIDDSEWVVGASDSSWGNLGAHVGCSVIPAITISSPTDSALISSGTTEVNIIFSTENAPGSSTVDITVTTNGGTPAVFTDETSPFTITPTSDGDTFEVTASLNDGGVLDFDTINFSIEALVATDLVINEFLADPAADPNGDANGDGVRDGNDDEFIEIYNSGASSIDLEGYTLSDGVSLRHTFTGTVLPAGGFITVFGGGTPTGISGIVQVANEGGSPALGLNNGGDTITLRDGGGVKRLEETYGSEGGNDTSLAREPDFSGSFVLHTAHSTNPLEFSPGVKNDGTLSIEDTRIENFSFSPNPTSLGYVNISSRSQAAMRVNVYDVLGKQVVTKTVSNNRLDVSNLNTGIYIMKITQGKATSTKKLVIN